MARVKIELPANFHFTCMIPVRITDINYGGHVGNDSILSLLHEARMQYLSHYGYTEMACGGTGLIMSDVQIEFKSELFYGETIIASVAIKSHSKIGFELVYLFQKQTGEKKINVVIAKTGMICYDYENKKIVSTPAVIINTLR